MCGPLLVLALLFGGVEFWIASKIAAQLGTGDTAFILLCSCGLGLWICKKLGAQALHGSSALRDLHALPKEALLFLIAGALFLFPGFASDALGYALLLKPCRRFLNRLLPQRPFRSSVIKTKTANDRDIDDPTVIVVNARPTPQPDSDEQTPLQRS